MRRRDFISAAGAMAIGAGATFGNQGNPGAPHVWTKEIYESSISSRCWWYTPYDTGWGQEYGEPGLISRDDELRQIVEMELGLGEIPPWAEVLVTRGIKYACPCGHYRYPSPFLELLAHIGAERAPGFPHGCFAVDGDRKRQAMDYCLCLDTWLTGAGPEVAAQELALLGHRKIDWERACADLWQTLGAHEEWRELAVERLLHLLRFWVKFTVWDDDAASEFGRDEYLGTCKGLLRPFEEIDMVLPAFDEGASPRLQRLTQRLKSECPEELQWGDDFVTEWWLCAPKAFRFLECNLWQIGRGRRVVQGEPVPVFLGCEDTYPNQDEAAAWFAAFTEALAGWWQGATPAGQVGNRVSDLLGTPTPVKAWLVRLFRRKLMRLVENGEQFTSLVTPERAGRRGTGKLFGI